MCQVLRWFGHFKEAVQHSPAETSRIRHIVIHFYLENNTLDVEEPREENSGIIQVLPQPLLHCGT